MEDVAHTARPHPLANCLTCKTPNFAKPVNDQGVSAYKIPFDEAMAMMEENVSCYTCHKDTDMVNMVHRLQERVTTRETEVGNALSAIKDALAAAVKAGDMGEEELAAVQKLYREAQWFFGFCYVENAEGAHNSELAFRCLDTAEQRINEGMALLGK